MSALIRLVTMVLAVIVVLATVVSAPAQYARPPRDPAAIQKKLQRSAELQRQALQALADPGSAEALVKRAWTELKSAQDDMVINASNMRTRDPLFEVNNKRADQALALVLRAWDTLKARDRWSDPAGQTAWVRDSLQQALRLTNLLASSTF